jgi:anti-sigma regulatory factor (Ser/Thr protein kinase)
VNSSLEQEVARQLRLVAKAENLGVARGFVECAAVAFGLEAEASFDFVLAANEAVTNAIRHGRPDEQGRILLLVVADGERLTLVVHDYGAFRTPSPESPPRLDSGRGLAMMRRLTDTFELIAEAGGTTVRLSKDRG